MCFGWRRCYRRCCRLDPLFKSDADDGTLEQLALSGQGLTVIVVAKTLAHWLVSGAALVLVSPLVATALGIPDRGLRDHAGELGAWAR